MGKSSAVRRAERGLTINLFSANTHLGWKVIRHVPVELAIGQLAQRKWREIWYEADADGKRELAGVQPLPPAEKTKTLHQVLAERLVAVTITLPEVQRNAGLYGRSHTLGMPEWKRLTRHARHDTKRILAPEDAIERAIEKVRLWPYPASVLRDKAGNAVTDANGKPQFGDKAVRTYPHPPKKAAKGK